MATDNAINDGISQIEALLYLSGSLFSVRIAGSFLLGFKILCSGPEILNFLGIFWSINNV